MHIVKKLENYKGHGMATHPQYPRRKDLDRLQERFNRQRRDLQTDSKDAILASLIKNLDSQSVLAKWLDLLRDEQGVLLNRMRDKCARK